MQDLINKMRVKLNNDNLSYMIVKYHGTDESVDIPSHFNGLPITIIGEGAFKNSKIKKVSIPNEIKIIEKSAFSMCEFLLEIIFSNVNSIMYIGESAFFMAKAYNKPFHISRNCEFIGNEAFRWSSINTLTVDINNLQFYLDDMGVFSGCTSLLEIEIPHQVKEIKRAFSDCYSLKTIKLNDNLESIGGQAFEKCLSLENVSFSKNSKLQYIGHRAFSECEKLSKIKLPKTITTISDHCFQYCSNLTSVEIEKGNFLTKLGEAPFYRCVKLKKLLGFNNVVEMRELFGSFLSEYSEVQKQIYFEIRKKKGFMFELSKDNSFYIIKTIDFPHTVLDIPNKYNDLPVKEIMSNAFKYNTIEKLVLPEHIEIIHQNAFSRQPNLTVIEFNCINASLEESVIKRIDGDGTSNELYVYFGKNVKVIPHEFATKFSDNLYLSIVFDENCVITDIPSGAFKHINSRQHDTIMINDFIIPKSIKSIKKYALGPTNNVLIIPPSVDYIEEDSFIGDVIYLAVEELKPRWSPYMISCFVVGEKYWDMGSYEYSFHKKVGQLKFIGRFSEFSES
ncbi:MAG: leucine-rich repeat domain-containing protein [Tenericutes bacterium]|nr:leucine-rich repeat domain-containing protein [Mycoplasmatota bacterium]